jgi:quercetin dioxygenase-like cupin family protein
MATSEPLLRTKSGESHLLVAGENLSITQAGCEAGERIAGPHVHPGHAEAFYVLEGELSFVVGPEAETITIGAGGFVAVPPGVAHGYGTAGSVRARWLVIHASDGGFADFMRGMRDGVEVDWDIAPVPEDGGLSIDHAIVSCA